MNVQPTVPQPLARGQNLSREESQHPRVEFFVCMIQIFVRMIETEVSIITKLFCEMMVHRIAT